MSVFTVVPSDDEALVEPDRTWSYRELDAAVGVVAESVRATEPPPGLPVAVVTPRTAAGVIGVLAVARAGRPFLAVDPTLPRARQKALIAQSGARVVLAPQGTGTSVPAGAQLVELPERPAVAARGPSTVDPVDDDPAYLIYTSGTTGVPKGVLVGYGGVRHIAEQQRRLLDLDRSSRVYQLAAVSFDAFVFELLMALSANAALVLPGHRAAYPGPELVGRLRAERVSHLVATPTALAAMDPADLPELRVVCSVGERCTTAVRDRWLPGRRLFNLYGPAEATIWATFQELGPRTDPARIGRAIDGVDVLVLDDDMRPVGAGETGQLFLTGPTVALGYHGLPGLTAERFPPVPGGGARMYATGDRVEVGADGVLRFVGRDDEQVKINGARVEPAEVEHVLRGLPGIAEAAVVAVPVGGDDQVGLAAAFTCAGRQLDPAEVAAGLRAELPRWMVPSPLLRLPSLPTTTSGKIDRAALAALMAGPAAPEQGAERLASSGPLADLLLHEARALLGQPALPIEANFFDAGGHSTLAFQLVVRVGDALGCQLDLTDLFEAASLAGWARRVEEQLAQPAGESRPPVRPTASAEVRPSLGQVEILAAEQYVGGSAAYVSCWSEHVRGAFDADRFADALRETARHHETLRTRYRFGAAGATAVVDSAASIGDERRDLSGSSLDEAIRVVEQACARPYRLAEEHPVRLHVVRLGADEHVVTLMVHHVACDAVSFRILREETWCRYEGRPVPSRQASPYRDFAAWQAEFITSPAAQRQRDWWREQLAGTAPLRVAPGQGAERGHRTGHREPFAIDGRRALAIDDLCRELRVSPFVVLSAGYAVALAPYATATDHVIGTPCTARGMAAFDDTVGYFVNTLPLRPRVPATGPIRAWLESWSAECIATFARRDLPLPEITRQWRLPAGRAARLGALFAFNHTRHDLGEGRRRLRIDPGPVKFDLLLTLDWSEHRRTGEMVHDEDVLDADEAAQLLERFLDALDAITADPDAGAHTLLDAPPITADEFDFGVLPT